MRARFVFAERNFAAQNSFVNSTCYANIVTVKKMLSLIEEHNKVNKPKIGLSAVGLTAFAKKSGVTSGWESGSACHFRIRKYMSGSGCAGKFTRYMRLVNGISNEAMDLLRLDDDLSGDNTVYGLKALIPKDKSGEPPLDPLDYLSVL